MNAKTIAADGSQARANAGYVPPSSSRSVSGILGGAAAVASIAGTVYNAYQSKKAYDAQQEYNRKQIELSNTSLSRAVKDAQAAGLSPLAVTGGAQGAVSPDLNVGKAPSMATDQFSQAMQYLQYEMQDKLTSSQSQFYEASSAKAMAETSGELIKQQTQLENQRNQLEIQRASLEKLIQEGKVQKVEAENRQRELDAKIAKLEVETEKMRKLIDYYQSSGLPLDFSSYSNPVVATTALGSNAVANVAASTGKAVSKLGELYNLGKTKLAEFAQASNAKRQNASLEKRRALWEQEYKQARYSFKAYNPSLTDKQLDELMRYWIEENPRP